MERSATLTRELLKRGLAAEGFRAAAFGAKSEECREKSNGHFLFRLRTRLREPSKALFIYQGRYSFASVVESEQKSVCAMPYRVNADLPPHVRKRLPEHAQDIYREAYNHAYAAHAGEFDREKRAHMIAWAAVKRSYVMADDEWVPAK
jgi:cation transport regulator